jgi:hypothetical protein
MLLVSSIEGDILVLDLENKTLKPLLQVQRTWGMAVGDKRVYIFKGVPPEHPDNLNSTICSYVLSSDCTLVDEHIECEHLDAGIHQIRLYESHLFVLDTNWQRILSFDIDDAGHVIPGTRRDIEPFPRALSYRYTNKAEDLREYRHINAITYHKGKWYISCPFIMSLLHDPVKRYNTRFSNIAVLDESFKMVDDITLPHKGVHDLVFTSETEVWYLSFDFCLICFDIYNKKVVREVMLEVPPFGEYRWCRGLSYNGHVFVIGTSRFIQIVCAKTYTVLSVIPTPGYPCFITQCEFGKDVNH